MKAEVIPQSVLDRVKAIEEARASGVRTVMWAGRRQQGSMLVKQLLNTKDIDMQLITIEEEQRKLDILKAKQAEFKRWVENTKLFQTIVAHSGTGVEIYGFDENIELRLVLSSTKITTFEELPKELLKEFFINSPWYNPKEDTHLLE